MSIQYQYDFHLHCQLKNIKRCLPLILQSTFRSEFHGNFMHWKISIFFTVQSLQKNLENNHVFLFQLVFFTSRLGALQNGSNRTKQTLGSLSYILDSIIKSRQKFVLSSTPLHKTCCVSIVLKYMVFTPKCKYILAGKNIVNQ